MSIIHRVSKRHCLRFLSVIFLTLLALTVSGCGSSGSSGGGSSPQDTKIARIKIVPGTVMLTEIGQKETLAAKAFNAADEEVDAVFSWASSHPDEIGIDVNGEITAHALGSSEIKAVADGVTSQSAIALVAVPAAGAMLVSDTQIVADPAPVDDVTPFGLGFQYTVTLRGVTPPGIGEILLGTGEAPVGGSRRCCRAKRAGRRCDLGNDSDQRNV